MNLQFSITYQRAMQLQTMYPFVKKKQNTLKSDSNISVSQEEYKFPPILFVCFNVGTNSPSSFFPGQPKLANMQCSVFYQNANVQFLKVCLKISQQNIYQRELDELVKIKGYKRLFSKNETLLLLIDKKFGPIRVEMKIYIL